VGDACEAPDADGEVDEDEGETDPNDLDTDDDGISDMVDGDPLVYDPASDCTLNPCACGDGICDDVEEEFGTCVCDCNPSDTSDNDGDGEPNCTDGCPNDFNKTAPGACGCQSPETCPETGAVDVCQAVVESGALGDPTGLGELPEGLPPPSITSAGAHHRPSGADFDLDARVSQGGLLALVVDSVAVLGTEHPVPPPVIDRDALPDLVSFSHQCCYRPGPKKVAALIINI
jgi:hypothetical protein